MRIRRSKIALPFLLQEQIQQDGSEALSSLVRRDRAIAAKEDLLPKKTHAKLWKWIEALATEDVAILESKIISANSLLRFCVVLLGFLSGFFTSYGLCRFDGKEPVNLVFLLGFFFIIQCISIGFFIYASMRGKSKGVFPCSFAFVISRLLSFLPSSWREFSERFFTLGAKNYVVFGDLQKWFLLRSSQVFSLAFFVGVVVAFAVLVAVSDLAFAWSSTLDVSSLKVHSFTSKIALPWRDIVPEGFPSMELVEQSRFFRLEDRSQQANAKLFGLWWPFVGMCLLVYGLLPRILTYLFSYFSFEKKLKKTSLIVPGVTDVLARMDSKAISLSQPDTQVQETEDIKGLPLDALSVKENTIAINWSQAVAKIEAALEKILPGSFDLVLADFNAGGLSSPEQDLEIISQIEKVKEKEEILIVVKSWEPPLGEFLDFLKMLRASLGSGKNIGVVPIGYEKSQNGTMHEVKEMHAQAWSLALSKVEDPWLRLYKVNPSEVV